MKIILGTMLFVISVSAATLIGGILGALRGLIRLSNFSGGNNDQEV